MSTEPCTLCGRLHDYSIDECGERLAHEEMLADWNEQQDRDRYERECRDYHDTLPSGIDP